ncbi:MAG: heme ABC exporter ATP-binding protein CcmA [Gaiellaceae bacterium]
MSVPVTTGLAAPETTTAAAGSGPIVAARGLGRRYGDRMVFSGLDFQLERGGFLLVTGPNGSGKTTLLRLLAGLAAPSEGELRIALGRDEIGYVGHDPLVYRELTPGENLRLFERLYGVSHERSLSLLERFGLAHVAADRVSSFSRGMTQRLALCRALLHEPRLLLLDEPFSGLDADSASLLERELGEERRERAIVVATHEPERMRPLATGWIELP